MNVRVSCRIIASILLALWSGSPAFGQFFYSIRADGGLEWREHLGATDGTFNWVGGQDVGSGWQQYSTVFPGGDGVLYALATDGSLVWWKHNSYHDGGLLWQGPVTIATGLPTFKEIFSGGDGIIYGLQWDGTLVWYKHVDWETGGPTWIGPQTVGIQWFFLDVFPGDGGAIYGIQIDGTLLWYKHLGRDNGSFSWSGPIVVGSQWQAFTQTFAGAAGVIYALRSDGTLLWYRHRGYLDGTVAWDGPNTVGTGWQYHWVLCSPARTEGYSWPLSGSSGQQVSFSISSPYVNQVTIVRYQRQGDQNLAIPVFTTVVVAGTLQPTPAQPWQNGCNWTASSILTIPFGWQSGIYAAECVDPVGRVFRIPFIVKPTPGALGQFAVLANTNTWNAYNDWGGESKYSSPPAQAVSFQRPNPAAAPIDLGGVNHLTRAELWVLDWLHSTGWTFDVYSDTDFDQGIPHLSSYKALIISTHSEYWTPGMRNNLEAYIAGGGSVLYMSGNGLFEEVLLSPDLTKLTLFPAGQYPWRDPSYFRNLNPHRPERNVLGVAYRYDNYFTFAPFQVLLPSHHLFEGTGVSSGTLMGSQGLNGAASGWEMDTSLPGLAPDSVIVSAYGADDRGIAPANTELLAQGTNVGNDGAFGADMTYYRTPYGGFVFSAGSISFGGSLVLDPVLQQVVENALREAINGTADVHPGPRLVTSVVAAPDPFAEGTTFRYSLEAPARATLTVFDPAGRAVARVLDGQVPAGVHQVYWNGRSGSGAPLAAGTYYFRLRVDGEADGTKDTSGKLLIVR